MQLTKLQRETLEAIAKGEELVGAKHGGWWVGETSVNGRVAWALIRKILVSRSQFSRDDYEYYEINEAGSRALRGEELIYQAADETRWATIEELIAHDMSIRTPETH